MRWSLAVAGTLLALPAAVAGQSLSTAILEGTVTDSAGVPIPQAEVLATAQDGGIRRTAASDPRGGFRFGFLPPGSYRLTVRRIGFRPVVVSDLTLRGGRVEHLTVTLASAALRLDSVMVRASPVHINTNDTESGTRLTSRDLATLPIPDDAHNLVAFTPGARPDQIWGAANAQANNYQLDGVSVNHPGVGADFFTPATSWIQEIEIRGLGAGAEYGNFQGGLVNIITKSGTDRQEGELRTNGESWHLNGTNLHASEAGSEPAHRLEVEGQLRGPLLRNRVHYAAFGQYLDRGTRVLNRLQEIPSDFAPVAPADAELKLLGKLDWQPSGGKDFLTGSFGVDRLSADHYGLDGFQSPEATQRLRGTTAYYNLSWQRTWSARQFLEVKAYGFSGKEDRSPYAGADVPGIATLLEVNPRDFQNAEFRELRKPSNLGATVNWDLYVRTFGAEHHLKIGGEYAFASWLEQRVRNGGMTWRPYERTTPPLFDPSLPATWALSGPIISSWGGEVNLDSKVQNGAIFVQDYFRLTRRLSINPGLRLGHWVGQLRRADGSGYFTPISTTGWDPRIGLMLDLDGHAGFVAKAHWGIFHQSLFAGFFDRAEGADVYSDEERWAYSGPAFTDPRTTFSPESRQGSSWRLSQVVRLNETGKVEGYKEPYVEQATLGLEKTVGANFKLDALYVRRRNKDMVALVDRNLASNYSTYQNITVLDRFFRPVLFQGEPLVLPVLAVSNEDIIYWRALLLSGETTDFKDYYPPGMPGAQWASLTYQPDLVLTTVPEATRRFDQLQLVASARYPGWWASAAGTLTRLVGNLNSVTGGDDYTTSGAGPFVRLNEQTNFFGDLNNQSRFELKVQVGGNLPKGFRGGLFFTHLEGDRVTPTLTISDLALEFQLPDTSSTGDLPARLRAYLFHYTNGQRIFVQPRGSYRYPSRNSLDLHLDHDFRFGRTAMQVALDAFNALGASTVTEVQTSVNGSLDRDFPSEYGEIRQRIPPRTFRLGVVLRW